MTEHAAEAVAPDWHSIATRLAARLRVHASSASTGYRQDPRSINDPDAPVEPGMSGRWCLLDQYALADYEAAHNDGLEAPMRDAEKLLDELLWVITNSDGVVGLRLDGGAMPWPEVLSLYARSVADEFESTSVVRGEIGGEEWTLPARIDGSDG